MLLVLATSGCDPIPEGGVDFVDQRRDASADIFRSSELNSVDGAIELVQQAPASEVDFEGSTAEWIANHREQNENTIMFPRWEGQRKGAHHFAVRYSHIEIDFDYNMEHVGYEWQVDTMLKQVSPPVPLTQSEVESAAPARLPLNGLDSIPDGVDL